MRSKAILYFTIIIFTVHENQNVDVFSDLAHPHNQRRMTHVWIRVSQRTTSWDSIPLSDVFFLFKESFSNIIYGLIWIMSIYVYLVLLLSVNYSMSLFCLNPWLRWRLIRMVSWGCPGSRPFDRRAWDVFWKTRVRRKVFRCNMIQFIICSLCMYIYIFIHILFVCSFFCIRLISMLPDYCMWYIRHCTATDAGLIV